MKVPLVERKGKSQTNGSKDAKRQREDDHSYDAATNRQRGHDNSHVLVSRTRSSTGKNLSFFGLHSISSSWTDCVESWAVVAVGYA